MRLKSKSNEKSKKTTLKVNMENWNVSEEAILKRTRNCSTYFDVIPSMCKNKKVKLFESVQLNNIKTAMAFNIMVHSQPGIFELFLALYFRPDDHFVIHLDEKVNLIGIETYVCPNCINQSVNLMYSDYAKMY